MGDVLAEIRVPTLPALMVSRRVDPVTGEVTEKRRSILGGNSRAHWRRRNQETQRLKTIAFAECRQMGLELIRERVDIETVFIYPIGRKGSLPDPDGCVHMAKPYIDGIVTAGVLVDDRSRYVRYTPATAKKGEEGPMTVIRLLRVEP